MERYVVYENAVYQVNINLKKNFEMPVKVLGRSFGILGGPLTEALTELTGYPGVSHSLFILSEEKQEEVILACGWKFSTSHAWRTKWDDLWNRKYNRDKKWEQALAKRVTWEYVIYDQDMIDYLEQKYKN